MKFLSVVTPLPPIYNGCPTQKTFWGEKFIPLKITSCGRHNVSKHTKIKIGEKYIILDIYSKINFLYNR